MSYISEQVRDNPNFINDVKCSDLRSQTREVLNILDSESSISKYRSLLMENFEDILLAIQISNYGMDSKVVNREEELINKIVELVNLHTTDELRDLSALIYLAMSKIKRQKPGKNFHRWGEYCSEYFRGLKRERFRVRRSYGQCVT